MDKFTFRIMKHISKKNACTKHMYLTEKFGTLVDETLSYLVSENFLASFYAQDDVPLVRGRYRPDLFSYKLTTAGRSLLHQHQSEKIRFWLPIIISVLALAKSFSAEIRELLQQLAKLLK